MWHLLRLLLATRMSSRVARAPAPHALTRTGRCLPHALTSHRKLTLPALSASRRIFHDLSEIYARTADELLPPPVFPVAEADLPIGQLPPSLPFTDPVIPDLHPIPYLFSLHRLSLERANEQVAIRLFHQHQVASARRLYEAEVERIEDEYEAATKGVVEKLFEGVEERRKRLLEEKEGEGVTIGASAAEHSLVVSLVRSVSAPADSFEDVAGAQTPSSRVSEHTARAACAATGASAPLRAAAAATAARTPGRADPAPTARRRPPSRSPTAGATAAGRTAALVAEEEEEPARGERAPRAWASTPRRWGPSSA